MARKNAQRFLPGIEGIRGFVIEPLGDAVASPPGQDSSGPEHAGHGFHHDVVYGAYQFISVGTLFAFTGHKWLQGKARHETGCKHEY